MTVITHGMDVAAVRDVSRKLAAQATALQSLCTGIDVLIAQSEQMWKGPDSARFAAKWRSMTRTLIRELQSALEDLSRVAAANADAQQQGSDTLDGAAGGEASANPHPGHGVTPGTFRDPIQGYVAPLLDAGLPGPFKNFNVEWVLGMSPIPGVGVVVDAVSLQQTLNDPSLSTLDKAYGVTGILIDTAAGELRSIGKLNPVLYLTGVAASQTWDVVDMARQTDHSWETTKTTFTYMWDHPWDSLNAAGEGILGYLPKLASNFKAW